MFQEFNKIFVNELKCCRVEIPYLSEIEKGFACHAQLMDIAFQIRPQDAGEVLCTQSIEIRYCDLGSTQWGHMSPFGFQIH